MDFRVQSSFFTHYKTLRLEAAYGDAGIVALLRLWSYAAQCRPDGDLHGMEDLDILAVTGRAGVLNANFVLALVRIGFVDGSPGEYRLHNWEKHNPWVSASTQRSRAGKANALARWHKKGRHPEPVDGCPLCEEATKEQSGEAPHHANGNAIALPSHANGNATAMQLQCDCMQPAVPAHCDGNAPTPTPAPAPSLSASHDTERHAEREERERSDPVSLAELEGRGYERLGSISPRVLGQLKELEPITEGEVSSGLEGQGRTWAYFANGVAIGRDRERQDEFLGPLLAELRKVAQGNKHVEDTDPRCQDAIRQLGGATALRRMDDAQFAKAKGRFRTLCLESAEP